MKYTFNKETLLFEPYEEIKNIKLIPFCFFVFLFGIFIGCLSFDYWLSFRFDAFEISKERKEEIFIEYEKRAEIYLRRFPNSPIKSEMLVSSAIKSYDSTGILIPIELVLAQAQLESGMGLIGRSAEKNPFNVGEWDNKTICQMKNIEEGIDAYYFLVCNRYFSCRDIHSLLINFVNCEGNRYASNPLYEKKLASQYKYIKSYINNRLVYN